MHRSEQILELKRRRKRTECEWHQVCVSGHEGLCPLAVELVHANLNRLCES